MKKIVPAMLALAATLCGCISFEYDGTREPEPTASVKVFTDKAKIRQPYRVLGRAVVSGDSMDVSRDRLEEKLVSEAESVGADAILITAQEVTRSGSQSTTPQYMTSFDYDDSSPGWSAIYRDVDLTYGSVRGTPNDNGVQFRYRRTIKAEFLKYRPAEEKKEPAEPQKAPVKPEERTAPAPAENPPVQK